MIKKWLKVKGGQRDLEAIIKNSFGMLSGSLVVCWRLILKVRSLNPVGIWFQLDISLLNKLKIMMKHALEKYIHLFIMQAGVKIMLQFSP